MVLIDFSELLLSDYLSFDENGNELLLDGAPQNVVELYKTYKEIQAEEERTGFHIF